MRHVITQNIDNLHQVAGTRGISEFHGNRFKMRCIGCNRRWDRAELELTAESPPECPDCHGIVKSDTVMFGEPIPPDAISRSFEARRRTAAWSSARPPWSTRPQTSPDRQAQRRPSDRSEPGDSPERHLCWLCSVPAGEVMPAVVEELRKQEAPKRRRKTVTFSIVARDSETGVFGVAVSTAVPCVGACARTCAPGVGAIATQSYVSIVLGTQDSICWQRA
jgi:hypothetical protein